MLRQVASKLRSDFGRFYNDTSRERIRFTYGESPYAYCFKIRFAPSHRSVRFIVAKDGQGRDIEVICLEKTDNIIRDIDSIYQTIDQKYITLDTPNQEEFEAQIALLWRWGISGQRKNDVFKARAAWYQPEMKLDESTLAIGVIESVTVLKRKSSWFPKISTTDNLTLLELTFDHNEKIVLEVANDLVGTIYPGLVYMQNWMGSYNLMRFKSAKHHINFTANQLEAISNFLDEEVAA